MWGWQSYLQIWLEITEKFQLKQTLLSSPGILDILLLRCKTVSMARMIELSLCIKTGKPNEGGKESALVLFGNFWELLVLLSEAKVTF